MKTMPKYYSHRARKKIRKEALYNIALLLIVIAMLIAAVFFVI